MKKTAKTVVSKSGAKKKTLAVENKTSVPAEKKVGVKVVVKSTTKATIKKPSAKTSKTGIGKKSTQKVSRIVARVDVGWGNMLYIRGEGAGLSWEQGVPMICANDAEWHWIAETGETPISFKFLVNDEIWALGENVTINAGDIHISNPIF